MGGALLKAGNDWGCFLFRAASHSPDPALVKNTWMVMWRQRLENVPLFFGKLVTASAPECFFWLHGSILQGLQHRDNALCSPWAVELMDTLIRSHAFWSAFRFPGRV